MKAIWTGAIGFGLVNIPIRIFSATDSSALDLDLLDEKNFANIEYKRVNSSTGKEVAWENIVKGYKYQDEYVVLTKDDFEKAAPEKDKTITIEEFVAESEIPCYFFDTPYYLEPNKGGLRAYKLLLNALKKTEKVAVGSYVIRSKENFCMLKPVDNMIMLIHLRYPEEMRSHDELSLPTKTRVKQNELQMAVELIDQLTPKKFNINKYKNTYNNKLLKIIKTKAKGGKVKSPKFKVVKAKSKDLMEQLKESLSKKAS